MRRWGYVEVPETNEAMGLCGCFSIYYQTNHPLENGDLEVPETNEAMGLCGCFSMICLTWMEINHITPSPH